MNPGAAEFVPSWLPQSAAPADSNNKETVPVEKAAQVPSKPVPAPVAAAASKTENPVSKVERAWDDTIESTSENLAKVSVSQTVNGAPGGSNPKSSPPSKPPSKAGDDAAKLAAMAEAEAKHRDAMLDAKKPLNVVLLGHVDAGKSTISGHILFLTGNVDERTMDKYEKEAKALNRESWKFAFALDTSEQERAKGKTEECGQGSFTTETRRFTILDAPGHKNYVPHMIGGASQADIGILVISARKGEFETGFMRGGQTREHALLAKTSGVKQMVVLVNKLDDSTIIKSDGTWDKERFNFIKKELEPFMRQVGWNPKGLTWIPVSGLTGQNLRDKVPKEVCPWYKGETLLHTLENLRPPERLISGPVKMPISEKHKEMGAMVMGKLESGVISVNDKLVMMPNKVNVSVDALVLEGSSAQAAEPGDVVRLRLKGIEEEDIRVGMVLCSPHSLVSYTDNFVARLVILEHKSIICAGYSAVMHIHSAVIEFTVKKLIAELDRKTGKPTKKNPRFVRPKMQCVARLETSTKICVEPYSVFPQLGRFMVRDEGKTIAVGTVMKLSDILKKEDGGD